jgi:hypothetical protein
MEELYKPIIGEHSKHNISNNNRVRVIDFAAGKTIREYAAPIFHSEI